MHPNIWCVLCYSLLLLYKVHLGLDSYSGYQAHKIDITLCCCNQRYQLDCSTGCQIFHSSCKCWEVIFPIQTRVFLAYQMYIKSILEWKICVSAVQICSWDWQICKDTQIFKAQTQTSDGKYCALSFLPQIIDLLCNLNAFNSSVGCSLLNQNIFKNSTSSQICISYKG